MLDAAILFSGRGYGTLCLEHVGKAHTWRHDEIEFACTIASQLAVAIESEARAAAEASAREREQFLTAILDGSPIGIQIFGPDGTSRRCNAAQHRLLGIEPGATFDVLTDPVAASTGATAAFLRCRSGEPVELERRKVEGAANGSLQRDLDQLFFPVADHTGAITAVVQFTWDVGDRVEAERMPHGIGNSLAKNSPEPVPGSVASSQGSLGSRLGPDRAQGGTLATAAPRDKVHGWTQGQRGQGRQQRRVVMMEETAANAEGGGRVPVGAAAERTQHRSGN